MSDACMVPSCGRNRQARTPNASVRFRLLALIGEPPADAVPALVLRLVRNDGARVVATRGKAEHEPGQVEPGLAVRGPAPSPVPKLDEAVRRMCAASNWCFGGLERPLEQTLTTSGAMIFSRA
jgi:hypothetical protein